MRPVLLSTSYFPPVSWMLMAYKYQKVYIELHETYPKQTFRNRCIIASSSGKLSLSVPVIRINGNHTKTNDIHIDNSRNWQQLHWRSIETVYNKSPYYLYYRDQFELLFNRKKELLVELNHEIIEILLKILRINSTDINYTTDYELNSSAIDLRNSFSPKDFPYQKLTHTLPRYIQVFEENTGFIPDLSILDLLFNLGPEALPYLAGIQIIQPTQ